MSRNTDRQFLIICAKTGQRNLSRIARVLHISRETLYQELHRAERAIRPVTVGGTGVELCGRCRAEPSLPGRNLPLQLPGDLGALPELPAGLEAGAGAGAEAAGAGAEAAGAGAEAAGGFGPDDVPGESPLNPLLREYARLRGIAPGWAPPELIRPRVGFSAAIALLTRTPNGAPTDRDAGPSSGRPWRNSRAKEWPVTSARSGRRTRLRPRSPGCHQSGQRKHMGSC